MLKISNLVNFRGKPISMQTGMNGNGVENLILPFAPDRNKKGSENQ